MTTITDTITRTFRPAFAVAALLAALAAAARAGGGSPAAAPGAPGRPPPPPWSAWWRSGRWPPSACSCAEQAAGASNVGTYQSPPIRAPPGPTRTPAPGLDAVAQRIALSALNGAACDLHTTRERLVLSLDPNSGYTDVTWDDATREQALRAGTEAGHRRRRGPGHAAGLGRRRAALHRRPRPRRLDLDHLPF